MLQFLRAARAAATSVTKAAPVTLVAGNEAADLDSVVSAVALARLLSDRHAPRQFAPLLNAPSLILTDHNDPAASLLAVLPDPHIVGIMDHHADSGKHTNCEMFRVIEPVGSATSLVALEFKDYPFDLPLAKLLLAPILLDTVNLDPAMNRVTEKDVEAANLLLRIIRAEDPAFDSKALFDLLQSAKFDVSSLTCAQFLRKDYKQTKCKKWELGISSVGIAFSDLIAREGGDLQNVVQSLREYTKEKKIDILMVMTAFENDKGFNRELIVFSRNQFVLELFELLEGHSDMKLDWKNLII
ncbi:DHH phosphoesterase [Rhizoclosmatium globosum]|uniref:DHH phosphoesterase n=1 Tax=Rhizoclosmatium globosum TaxID=329046 RepID=A0A1Y2CVA2_9FUNG|nr:DHH phosphoesterase [Rhizoclosmatium globosum]|eukprot:ORY50897.1 DHH phosphoesterase [Rhizoclosmatium globosum]